MGTNQWQFELQHIYYTMLQRTFFSLQAPFVSYHLYILYVYNVCTLYECIRYISSMCTSSTLSLPNGLQIYFAMCNFSSHISHRLYHARFIHIYTLSTMFTCKTCAMCTTHTRVYIRGFQFPIRIQNPNNFVLQRRCCIFASYIFQIHFLWYNLSVPNLFSRAHLDYFVGVNRSIFMQSLCRLTNPTSSYDCNEIQQMNCF